MSRDAHRLKLEPIIVETERVLNSLLKLIKYKKENRPKDFSLTTFSLIT